MAPYAGPLSAQGPYYVNIWNQFDQPLVSTQMTRRFPTEDAAYDFCRQVEDGIISTQRLISESSEALHILSQKEHEAAKRVLEMFFSTLQARGISPDVVSSVVQAYEDLPPAASKLLRNAQVLDGIKQNLPEPEPPRLAFGLWLEAAQRDVDVCLEDADTGEHYVPAVCYLTEDDKLDPDLQYTSLEQWLFTLPVEKVETTQDNSQIVKLRTDFSCDQTNFLLGENEYGFSTQDWANLFDRAYYADADFTARLNYLQAGTPFEAPFDPHRMDSASPEDRQELLQFLERYPDALVAPAADDFLVVYHLLNKPGAPYVYAEDCAVCAKATEPGRGLASTLAARLGDAQQRVTPGDDRVQEPAYTHETL